VLDLTGRRIRRLGVAPGAVACRWDGCDAGGRRVPAGIYLARLGSRPGVAARVVVTR
jgi:hypothetical protein